MVWLKRDSLTVPASRFNAEPDGGRPSSVERSFAARGLEQSPHAGGDRAFDALAKIRKLVEGGIFPPRSRLPAERKLAEQLGVGRPVIREALKVLTTLGLLESRRGSGTYVKTVQVSGAPAFGFPEPDGDFGMLHLLEVRAMVEPRAAWLSATRANERQLAEIENARQRCELHDRDWKLSGKLDAEFHRAICRGAQNPVLEAIHTFLMTRLLPALELRIRFAPGPHGVRDDHRRIAAAVLSRQADAAEDAMRKHLHAATQTFLGGIEAPR